MGGAAQLHVLDHGYLPAAGWHWKVKEGIADPAGIGDTAGRRYTYYDDDGIKRPAPVTVALGLYLDPNVRLESRAALEEDLQGESLRQHFRCPSQPVQGRGLSQKEDGGGWEAPRVLQLRLQRGHPRQARQALRGASGAGDQDQAAQ